MSPNFPSLILTHLPLSTLSTKLTPSNQPQLDNPQASLSAFIPRHAAYLSEAHRLRSLYSFQLTLLVGVETEWIRPSDLPLIQEIVSDQRVDYVVGSVHHVSTIPIDFDAAFYAKAVAACGGTEAGLFAAYYDAQMEMLQALKPEVVGHFDLVRLLSEDPGRKMREWEGGKVWEKVKRNLELVKGYGGLLELNTSALRKGLEEPYPVREIAEVSLVPFFESYVIW